MADELYHHGILGQKWGKRNGPPYPLTRSSKSSRKKSSDETDEKKSATKTERKNPRKMSDQELKDRISRLELEKKYKSLLRDVSGRSSGRDFVMRVLEKSGENIAVQFTTDVMGVAVNKTLGKLLRDPSLVNPKKGQRDKK